MCHLNNINTLILHIQSYHITSGVKYKQGMLISYNQGKPDLGHVKYVHPGKTIKRAREAGKLKVNHIWQGTWCLHSTKEDVSDSQDDFPRFFNTGWSWHKKVNLIKINNLLVEDIKIKINFNGNCRVWCIIMIVIFEDVPLVYIPKLFT